jgi:5'-3' exonuclease
MENRYLILDGMNLFFRCLHISTRGQDIEERVSYSIHTTLQSIAAAWRNQQATHVVCALEGRSWRKDFYKPYKANREVARQAATVKEQEELKAFLEGYANLIDYLQTKTNVTILQHEQLEADDLIAGWIQNHPDDHHTIISSDSDYYQLLANNVNQFNGVTQELHTINGIFDYKGKLVLDKKTKLPKETPNPELILFTKICRGDPTDNIFSAYPGVRVKGTKNSVGINEAFEDRKSKGFSYNNFMLQRWTDHNGVEHRVLDDFDRNRILIDLSAQPEHIRKVIDETVTQTESKNINMIGAHFLKFCGKHNLIKISEQSTTYSTILSASYLKLKD